MAKYEFTTDIENRLLGIDCSPELKEQIKELIRFERTDAPSKIGSFMHKGNLLYIESNINKEGLLDELITINEKHLASRKVKCVLYVTKTILMDISKAHAEKKLIPNEVLFKCYSLMDYINPIDLSRVNVEDVTYSPKGTVVMEWKHLGDVFSLEIGSDKVGYFVEVDGIDIKQVDSMELGDPNSELQKDLTAFLTLNETTHK